MDTLINTLRKVLIPFKEKHPECRISLSKPIYNRYKYFIHVDSYYYSEFISSMEADVRNCFDNPSDVYLYSYYSDANKICDI